MDRATFELAINNRLEPYLKVGPRESIKRNQHMNDLDFSKKLPRFNAVSAVKKIVSEMIAHSPDPAGSNTGAVMDALRHGAVESLKKLPTQLALDEALVFALAVDFLNYVASTACMDYGAYACDLRSHRHKYG